MKRNERTVSKIVRLLLSSITAILLVASTYVTTRGQEGKRITKDNLLSGLALGKVQKKSTATYVEMIEQYGVDFRMTNKDERDIREVGEHLGAGLDEVVAAVRDCYGKCRRIKVSLFKYAPCETYLEQFESVIRSNMFILSSKFSAKGEQYNYVKRLSLVNEGKPLESQDDWERYWKKKTRALQLLQGTCSTKVDGVYMYSHVFLGDLNGPLEPAVRVEFKFVPEEFGKTKDIHSVLLLYSLAQEAKARGLSKDLIISYLSEARQIVDQVRNTDATTLQSIKDAIGKMLGDLAPSPEAALAR